MRIPCSVTRAATLAVLVVVSGCGGSTDGPVATTLVIAPSPVNLAAVGQTQQLTGQVLDQNGNAMTGVAVSWSSNNGAVISVSATGLVTALGNGATSVTATAAALTTNVPVNVTQVAAQLVRQAGDGQNGTVGAALGTGLRVRVNDALGSPMPGASVTYAVASGGGSLSATSATTDAAGEASVTWTLGTTAGAAQQVSATVGALPAVQFNATAVAGPASQVVKVSGDNQTGAPSVALAVAPRVRVEDQFGNPRSGHAIQFTANNGGSVTGNNPTTNAQGEAALGSWVLGAGAGAQTLTAAVTGTALNATFNATAAMAGTPTSMVAFAGDNQTALVGFPTNIRPAVRVTDVAALPVAGVNVTFAVTGGGGSVTTATVATNANGVAQVGNWTVGGSAGANTLQATAGGLSAVNFAATGQTAQFNIEIRNIGPAFSPAVQTAFDQAKAYWESAIYGELSNVAFSGTSVCGGLAVLTETVDDLLILARFDSIDGPSQILGSAGACSIRTSNGLTIVGQMRFDTADVAGLIAAGSINAVILHEMGHVLGFSTGLWNTQSGITNRVTCAQNLSTPGGPLNDTHFLCTQAGAVNDARMRFDSIGGTTYTGGIKVPLENCVAGVPPSCGAGNINSHWREAVFNHELMTPYLNNGVTNPLSVVTLATFTDIGYLVNYAVAQSYTQVFTSPVAVRGPFIDLSNDEIRGPIEIIDERTGRVVRVIHR